MTAELARIKHLLGLASDCDRQAETATDTHKREEIRKLAWTYRQMVQAQIALITAGVHRVDGGLYLQIDRGGRSWVHRFTFKGRARWSGLGSARTMTLAEARAARDAERAMIRTGIDPVAARRAERQAA
jgi:hypothetical protein